MVEEKSVFPSVSALDEAVAYVGGGDGSMVMDHEIVFVSMLVSAITATDFLMTNRSMET
jgi:hypothetical protein